MSKLFIIKKYNDEIIKVILIHHKIDKNKYSFINLSHGHICPCIFNSIDEAIDDLNHYISNGKIKEYKECDYNILL